VRRRPAAGPPVSRAIERDPAVAKKKVARGRKKTAKKKTTRKKASARAVSKKKSSRKTTRKSAGKKSTRKASTGKAVKKSRSKKASKKKGARKSAGKAASKKTSARAASKKKPSRKSPAKTAGASGGGKKEASGRKAAPSASRRSGARGKSAPKSAPPASRNGSPDQKPQGLEQARAAASRLAAAAGLRPVELHEMAASPSEPAKRLKKTPLNKRQLDGFRKRLLEKRAEVFSDVSDMEISALHPEGHAASSMPQHMADQGSDEYDQSLMLGLAESQRKLIREIDEALERIEDRTYGVCHLLGTPIQRDRLEAMPWTKYSLEGARLASRQAYES